MNKTDSFVWNLSHWSNAISNVAISRQYTTEQYDIRIARWYIAIDKRDFFQLADRLHAIWHTFPGDGYRGYSELIEISEKIFQNRKILKIFGSFNNEASDFWNFPANPLILIDF